MMYAEEWEAVKAEYGLPELPDYYDGPRARQLILFRQDLSDENIALGESVSLEDARTYCSRDDTHGNGWFVGAQAVDDDHNTWEPNYGQDELLNDPDDGCDGFDPTTGGYDGEGLGLHRPSYGD